PSFASAVTPKALNANGAEIRRPVACRLFLPAFRTSGSFLAAIDKRPEKLRDSGTSSTATQKV
nr:hypothetical protein [Pseudomonadota bacterium]